MEFSKRDLLNYTADWIDWIKFYEYLCIFRIYVYIRIVFFYG